MYHYLVVAIINLFLALVVLFRKDSEARYPAFFCLICLFLWALELFFLSVIENEEILLPLFYATRWGMFFMPVAVGFFSYYIKERRSNVYLYFLIFPLVCASLFISVSSTFFDPSLLIMSAGGYLPKPDIYFYMYFVCAAFCMLATIVFNVIEYKTYTYREKMKMKVLLVNLLVLFALGLISIVVYLNEEYLESLVASAANLIMAFTFFFGYSRSHMFDYYFSITTVFVKIVAVVVYVVGFFLLDIMLGGIDLDAEGIIIISLFLFVVTQSFNFMEGLVLATISRLFLNRHVSGSRLSEELGRPLSECEDVRELFEALCQTTKDYIGNIDLKFFLSEDAPLEEPLRAVGRNSANVLHFNDVYCGLESFFLANEDLLIEDEVGGRALEFFVKNKSYCCFSVVENNAVVVLVSFGWLPSMKNFSYEKIAVTQRLKVLFRREFLRLLKQGRTYRSLQEARKTLSMIDIMNQYHHDIKTPLAIIDGVISADIYDFKKQREIVLEQVDQGTRLIATMAKVLQGKRIRKVETLQIESILRDSLFIFEKKFDRVDLELDASQAVRGDAIDLKILFINLIKNACEARDLNRSLQLKISAFDGDGEVIVKLSDSGCGLSEHMLDELWSRIGSKKQTGSGIGLQAVKRIADEHAADITVSSKKNDGTSFVLRFPVIQEFQIYPQPSETSI